MGATIITADIHYILCRKFPFVSGNGDTQGCSSHRHYSVPLLVDERDKAIEKARDETHKLFVIPFISAILVFRIRLFVLVNYCADVRFIPYSCSISFLCAKHSVFDHIRNRTLSAFITSRIKFPNAFINHGAILFYLIISEKNKLR